MGVGPCALGTADCEAISGARLVVDRGSEDPFTQEERALLRGMAQVLSLALQARRLLDEERTSRASRSMRCTAPSTPPPPARSSAPRRWCAGSTRACALVLEITENLLVRHVDAAKSRLDELKALGVRSPLAAQKPGPTRDLCPLLGPHSSHLPAGKGQDGDRTRSERPSGEA